MSEEAKKKTGAAGGTDPEAPHGRDPETGVPLAPYGFKTDGTPRLSNRGRQAKKAAPGTGPGTGAQKGRSASAQKAREQRDGLMTIADAILSPAMAAAGTDGFARRVGQRRADGIAGSLVILDGFVPSYADWLVSVAASKPGMLAWMDRMEDNAHLIQGAILTAQVVKAIAGNLAAPDPRLAEAARLKARMRNAQMADAIEQQAAAMGISLVPEPEPMREHTDHFHTPPQPAGMPA